MLRLIYARLRGFAEDTRASISMEAMIAAPFVLWALGFSFTYFESLRAHAVAEKTAYTLSDMISRETQPLNAAYLTNARQIYMDLSGLNPGETALRVTMLRWNKKSKKFLVDWSQRRGEIPRLRNRDVTEYDKLLPNLVNNERVILVETASDFSPSLKVGFKSRVIETFVFTRPRFAPQIVWDNET